LNGNFYILADAVRMFEKVCIKRAEIIHQNTIHRILGTCCLIVAKFHYDGYNSKDFGKVLGVRRNKMATMENM